MKPKKKQVIKKNTKHEDKIAALLERMQARKERMQHCLWKKKLSLCLVIVFFFLCLGMGWLKPRKAKHWTMVLKLDGYLEKCAHVRKVFRKNTFK